MPDEWVIVNGHVLGHCAYLKSLDYPWDPPETCDCADRLENEREIDDDFYDDLAYEGGW